MLKIVPRGRRTSHVLDSYGLERGTAAGDPLCQAIAPCVVVTAGKVPC